MPSTRISICLICACTAGTIAIVPSRAISTTALFVPIDPPFLKMQAKLLGNSETDVTPHRHEQRAGRMCNVPVHSKPNMHTWTQADKACDPGQQRITSAPFLADSSDPVIRRVQPSEHRTDEPFASHISRFIRPIGKPEPRLEVTAKTSSLRALGAEKTMEILIGDQSPDPEQPGVCPIRCPEQISRA